MKKSQNSWRSIADKKKILVEKICLPAHATILDAVQNLNDSKLGVVLISDESTRLIGTVTDADIRAGLLNKQDLSGAVDSIVNRQTTTLPIGSTETQIREKFIETKLRAIPLLEPNGTIKDCVFLDQFAQLGSPPKILMVMAGGLGLRMGELTASIPKPMLEIKGKQMLQYIIEQAVKENFKEIFISTHYLGEKIKELFRNGEKYKIPISYINEDKPLGTAGSFEKLPLDEGPVVVTNADVLSDLGYSDLMEYHQLNNADITIAVHTHIIKHPFGVVKSSGIDLIEIEEKPNWITNINAGIYVLDAKVKFLISKNEALPMTELVSRVQKNGGRVKVFPLHEDWVDLGSQTDYYSHRD